MTPAPSDHFNGKTFFNPGEASGPDFADLIRWKTTSRPAPWPEKVEVARRPAPPAPEGDGLSATWIGQSTFLLRTAGLSFLTDPIFSERAGPFGWVGPRRVMPPAIALSELPRIDAVLLSHDHYDHCDLPSLRCLAARDNCLFVAPLGHRGILESAGAARITELDWWESADAGEAKVTLVPARHWCRRRPFATNVRLWGGFVIRAGGRLAYFVGDSGYHERRFAEIRERCGRPDLAMIPIGAYEPRWFMADAHMNPEEAVRVHRDVGARRSVAMHWGTFQLTDEGREEPVLALEAARQGEDFTALEPGATVTV
jgi:L-ascorbate metabolism protein UlaG (beta-lactamase superfamily)